MTDHIGIGGAWKAKAGEWIGVGGAWKRIAGEWIGVGGAWKPFASAVPAFVPFSTTMTAGKDPDFPIYGYDSLASYGSCSPTDPPAVNASGGYLQSITSYGDDLSFIVQFAGFSSDPGQNYFSQVVTNAVGIGTLTTGFGVQYFYSAGVASWVWEDSSDFAEGSSYSLVFS